MKTIIKTLIKSSIDHMDALVNAMDGSKQEVALLVGDIIKKDKAGEDCSEIFQKQRVLTGKASLMEQDLLKVINKVNVFYNLAKSADVDLGLNDDMTKRLEYMKEQEHSFYIIDKGNVIPRDKTVMDTLETRIRERKSDIYDTFIKNIRESPMYKADLDKKMEDNSDTKSE